MAHHIEMRDGVAQMAFVGETPWHGLGTRVPPDLTPVQMLEAAGLDWTVQKAPAFVTVNGKQIAIDKAALVRSGDDAILDVVSSDWNPVQNLEAFEFFNDFVAAGDMEMHTAGSLRGGQVVWALAKVKESFDLFKGDVVDSYLLLSSFHKYGCSTDTRFVPIRVVCANTLALALDDAIENRFVKVSHARKFDGDTVKQTLGIAREKLQQYKETAAFLGSKKARKEDIVDYFKRIFPVTGPMKAKEISKNAEIVSNLLETQPGSNFAPGTWWQPFNAVTYFTDHMAGRTADSRLNSAWYGSNKNLKIKALQLAVEMADA